MFSPSLEISDVCKSTNELGRAYLLAGNETPKWFVTRKQTNGRGRLGRIWLDEPGNFMGSLAFVLSSKFASHNCLPFLTSLALHDAITTLIPVVDQGAIVLKWPNDVLLNQGKLSGCLIETLSLEGKDGAMRIVLGVGVNVSHAPVVDQVRTAALCDVDQTIDLNRFTEVFTQQLNSHINLWQKGELSQEGIFSRWQAHSFPLGTVLKLQQKDKQIVGAFMGLGEDGCLCLRLKDGQTFKVYFGDVNLFGSSH